MYITSESLSPSPGFFSSLFFPHFLPVCSVPLPMPCPGLYTPKLLIYQHTKVTIQFFQFLPSVSLFVAEFVHIRLLVQCRPKGESLWQNSHQYSPLGWYDKFGYIPVRLVSVNTLTCVNILYVFYSNPF